MTPATASERSIFTKIMIIMYKRVFCVAVNKYVYLYFGVQMHVVAENNEQQIIIRMHNHSTLAHANNRPPPLPGLMETFETFVVGFCFVLFYTLLFIKMFV